MKIEIIDNQRFAEIWVDGEKVKEVHKKLYKNHLREILRMTEKKDLSDLFLRIDVKITRQLVYKWLALRGFMKSELTKKLKSYKIDPRAIDKVLIECEKLGYLDDRREGRLLIERSKRKGKPNYHFNDYAELIQQIQFAEDTFSDLPKNPHPFEPSAVPQLQSGI